ncbi:DNA-binding MarR family transcriptional regulator [Propionicimonas paludicola]|uniref:DNA-binding MarR family transcriptional regulator n=1 Tax=Propionicimonas paludicola TaxID=185243 RepID=A0A2A9CXB7_9ACTN|nr:DNA-binding MarR family transcriptional regulator [Propionicimonas paludicola]
MRFEANPELAPHHASALFKLMDGPRTPSELAEQERVAAPSMTRTVNCLVERGLASLASNPNDGRSKLVALTDSGRDALEQTVHARDDWMMRRLAGLSEADQEILRAATEVLNRVLDA